MNRMYIGMPGHYLRVDAAVNSERFARSAATVVSFGAQEPTGRDLALPVAWANEHYWGKAAAVPETRLLIEGARLTTQRTVGAAPPPEQPARDACNASSGGLLLRKAAVPRSHIQSVPSSWTAPRWRGPPEYVPA
jgi:hypothetical protein